MDFQARLEELKSVASRLSIQIESRNLNDEEFRFTSGYCKVNGQNFVILDNCLTELEQIKIITDTLREFDLDRIYVAPWIRELIENQTS